MAYQSTRNNKLRASCIDVIKRGISPEGGLFVPVDIPVLDNSSLFKMIDMDYRQRAAYILSNFLDDFSYEEIEQCVNSAYRNDNFDNIDIAPVVRLNEQMFFLELWHGPTCAFKDMALQLLPYMMTTALKKTNEDKKVVVLVATSGDTGKAALEGFKEVDGTSIIVFYPKYGVSKIQRAQMVTQQGSNVHVLAVSGNFDDAQTGVKQIFGDIEVNQKLAREGYFLSSANSINWGRLMPQIVYYFSAYLDMLKNKMLECDESFNVVVPTGNFGNILAAYYAKCMGLPIHKFICASNRNSVLTDFINTGIYNRNRKFYKTISPSMDILISSNLERLLFELSGKDDKIIIDLMKNLQQKGEYRIDEKMLKKMQSLFWGGFASDRQTLESIKDTYNEHNYIIDPHTAVAKHVYDMYKSTTGDSRKTLIVSTASPFKFADDVLKAIAGIDSIRDKDEYELLKVLSSITCMGIPKPLAELKEKSIIHNIVCEKQDMKYNVFNILNLDGE